MDNATATYWRQKANRVNAQPLMDFDIVNWQGKPKNVKAVIVEVYEHLAVCDKAHSLPMEAQGRRRCTTSY